MSFEGLFFKKSGKQLPLKGIHHNVTIEEYSTYLVQQLEFKNESTSPVELIYKFPTSELSSPHKLTIELFDPIKKTKEILDGKIKEKTLAEEDYDDGISSGRTSALLKKTKFNVLEISLGLVRPNICIKVFIHSVVQTQIEKRQADKNDTVSMIAKIQSMHVKKDYGQIQAAMGNLVQKTGSAEIIIDLGSSSSIIEEIRSPSHSDVFGEIQKLNKKLWIWKTKENEKFGTEKDFIVECKISNYSLCKWYCEQQTFLERSKQVKSCHLLSIIPSFDYQEERNSSEEKTKVKTEIIIILDRSGSMSGTRMRTTLECLKIFFNSLDSEEQDIIFNIISFGSRFEYLFRSSLPFNEENYEKVTREMTSFSADFGGTNIYGPFEDLFEKYKFSEGYSSRQIFFFSDGEDYETNRIFELVEKYSKFKNQRIFSVGIGKDINPNLISNIAKLSGGRSVFIEDISQIHEKIITQLEFAVQPSFRNCCLSINFEGNEEIEFFPILEYEKIGLNKFRFPVIYNNRRFVRYFNTQNGINFKSRIELKFEYFINSESGEKKEIRIEFPKNYVNLETNNIMKMEEEDIETELSMIQKKDDFLTIGSLFGYEKIKYLEKQKKEVFGGNINNIKILDEQILKLGLNYNLISSKTSFVMVSENNEDSSTIEKEIKVIEIDPVQYSNDRNFSFHPVLPKSTVGFASGSSARFGTMFPPPDPKVSANSPGFYDPDDPDDPFFRQSSESSFFSLSLSSPSQQQVVGGGKGGAPGKKKFLDDSNYLQTLGLPFKRNRKQGVKNRDEIGEMSVDTNIRRKSNSRDRDYSQSPVFDFGGDLNIGSGAKQSMSVDDFSDDFSTANESFDVQNISLADSIANNGGLDFENVMVDENFEEEQDDSEEKEKNSGSVVSLQPLPRNMKRNDIVGKILQFADFNGIFKPSSGLFQILGVLGNTGKLEITDFEKIMPKMENMKIEYWITLIVVTILKKKFFDFSGIWKFIVKKADRMLLSKGVGTSVCFGLADKAIDRLNL